MIHVYFINVMLVMMGCKW